MWRRAGESPRSIPFRRIPRREQARRQFEVQVLHQDAGVTMRQVGDARPGWIDHAGGRLRVQKPVVDTRHVDRVLEGTAHHGPLVVRRLRRSPARQARACDVAPGAMRMEHDLRASGVKRQGIVCAQNGVANEAMALRLFPNVYGMLVFLPALFLEPGEVVTNASDVGGVLDTGLYTGGIDSNVEALTAALTNAGFGAAPDGKVMRKKYGKLLTNLNNALGVLTDVSEGSNKISQLMQAEALACYSAAGIDCASGAEMKALYAAMQVEEMEKFPRSGGSSWQSAMRGTGNIEVDYLNGEIAQLGRRYGVLTPANAVCQEFAWRLSHEKGKPGSVGVGALLAAIEKA